MISLQNQYNLLKEGKLAKDVFLKYAKETFPQYIPNSMGFEPAIHILKQRSVIREDSSYKEVPKKTEEGFEKKFKSFLAEAKKEEKAIKADLKKTDKSVEATNDAANYDNTDTKSANNVIFDQYMRGIYTEMSEDPKQDLDKVKKTVLKNLTKDSLYYLKNGQFGVKGLGYSDELPGAKTAKDDKMIALSKEKMKSNVKDTLSKKEAAKGAPAKVKEMSTAAKNSKGVKKMANPSKGKIIKLKENQSLESLMNEVDINEGPESQDDSAYVKKLATDLVKNAAFVSDTEINSAEKLMSSYSSEDIEEFYKEIFGKLPLGNPASFSVNERLASIINKVMNEGGMEDADATLAKQEADAEAKAAALSKQRADNKAKIAAANKNI
jgi:hypothetical protein